MKKDDRNEELNVALFCFLIFIVIFSFYNIFIIAPKNSEKEEIKTEKVEDSATVAAITTPAKETKETKETREILISSCTIEHSSSENRDYNMSLACSKIDNLILKPNEEFNWYNVVGQATKENGFKKSSIIVNKKYVQGYGGGVCQVATAVYNLIYQVDIKPTELNHHSLQSSYVTKGMDATVSWHDNPKYRKNFVFINTKDYPIKIKIHEENGNVVAELYQISE